jgi:hypothetical protein
MEFVKDIIAKFAIDNGVLIVGALIALVAVGMLLGSARKMIATLFVGSLNAGEAAAKHLIEKPKGVLLSIGLTCIVLPSIAGGYWLSPTKIMEKPVIVEKPVIKIVEKPIIERVPVTDNSMIERLQRELAQASARGARFEEQLSLAQRNAQTLSDEKQQYAARVADLNSRLYALTPTADKQRMQQLSGQLDELHETQLQANVARAKITRERWESLFLWPSSSAVPGREEDCYHKQCAPCMRNYAVYKQMALILKQHGGWTVASWED